MYKTNGLLYYVMKEYSVPGLHFYIYFLILKVENEYGSYGACDFAYTSHMRDLVRSGLGNNVLLFSTDGSGTGYLKCGKIPGVYSTVDFGSGGRQSIIFFVTNVKLKELQFK